MPPRKKTETRAAPIVGTDDDGAAFRARVIAYDVPDSYGTVWRRGVFTESVQGRLPVLCWGHDWREPVGRAIGFEDLRDGLYLDFRLDDPDDVPRARQARAQLRSGTLTDVSVGFERKEWQALDEKDEGEEEMIRAGLDEVSLVVVGAVPGAQVLAGSVRAVDASGVVDANTVALLAVRLAAGDIDLADALQEIKAAASSGEQAPTQPPPQTPPATPQTPETPQETPPRETTPPGEPQAPSVPAETAKDDAALEAEIEEALLAARLAV